MHQSFHEDISRIIEEMTKKREALVGTAEEMKSLSETVTSKNRMIKVSVDARGRLTELKLAGNRWRELSAKELGALLVEAVTKAQDAVYDKAIGLMSTVAPEGLDVVALSKNGPSGESFFPDFEKLWRSAE